jgi:hypothetical protein
MRKRVYIETTIPSFYYTLRTDPESVARMNWTRQWWKEFADQFELVTSEPVVAELSRGKGSSTQERLSLLDGLELLQVTDEVEDIARIYVSRLVMPSDPAGDAMHLALASFHRIDVLLTWNCQHLANPNKMEHIQVVNFAMRLPVPLVATPLNYFSGEEDNV